MPFQIIWNDATKVLLLHLLQLEYIDRVYNDSNNDTFKNGIR